MLQELSFVYQDYTKSPESVISSGTDTLWFSYQSTLTIDQSRKYPNWQTPKLSNKSKIGFEFYSGALNRKLEMTSDGKIKSIGTFAKRDVSVGYVTDEIAVKPNFNYKFKNAYEDRYASESVFYIYHDVKNQSIVEFHYSKKDGILEVINFYANTANNPFVSTDNENLLLNTIHEKSRM